LTPRPAVLRIDELVLDALVLDDAWPGGRRSAAREKCASASSEPGPR